IKQTLFLRVDGTEPSAGGWQGTFCGWMARNRSLPRERCERGRVGEGVHVRLQALGRRFPPPATKRSEGFHPESRAPSPGELHFRANPFVYSFVVKRCTKDLHMKVIPLLAAALLGVGLIGCASNSETGPMQSAGANTGRVIDD